MIVVKTPLRISFAGGGSDFKDFSEREGGCVVSSAIDKSIYVVIKERFDSKIRIGYSQTEMTDSVDELHHELARETMRLVGLRGGVEISTMADIPSEGSGLGSSSTVTVGLLHALHAYMGDLVTAEQLAQEACQVEIDILGKPIGKQDQYIAAYGGLRRFTFKPDGAVETERLLLDRDRYLRFSEQIMLFFTGKTRKSSDILTEQKASIVDCLEPLRRIRDQAYEMHNIITSNAALNRVGRLMNENWALKKSLASGVSNQEIDDMYERAIDAGADGGKITGAGGGGFLMLICPPDRQSAVRQALIDLRELPFTLEHDGSKIVLNAQ